MFGDLTDKQSVQRQAAQILGGLQTHLDLAEHFNDWLTAQVDADLGPEAGGGLGFDSQDITFLRSAFADIHALGLIAHNQMPPGGYPQPSAPHDYIVNAKQVIGPVAPR